MVSSEHELLILRSELKKQELEHEKAVANVKSELRQTYMEIEKLRTIKTPELPVTGAPTMSSPIDENNTIPKGGRFFQNGDRMPDDKELANVWGSAEEGEIFGELQDWVNRDRAATVAKKQAQALENTRPDQSRWFGGNRPLPTLDEMADPKNLQEMLRELDRKS